MSSAVNLEGRTAVVTGAGAGLGRSEALALAGRGADVVVNDTGPAAEEVAEQIRATGCSAVTVRGDVGEWAMGEKLVRTAVDELGGLDIVVNNAGITRDRMLFNLSEQDWDDVIRVHLKGHAALSRAAGAYWREESKRTGGPVYARLVNTSSEAFLFGGAGQPNYSAAKAGITALTLSAAQGLAKYGVRANAICPRARTGMTADVFAGREDGADAAGGAGTDILSPDRVGTFVSYLASPEAEAISGQVFVVYGDMVAVMAAPEVEQTFISAGGVFTPEELAGELGPYFAGRDPRKGYAAYGVAELDTTGVGNSAAPR
ncbi:3-oxoacyl-ACP reductase [Nocardiopsis sp. HNM0947]|uniref:3-oxoacyl-ACP reductase n=1 Tax=Nocardiopsis coralli TaxID=2772213 RepID=A0ABR9PEW0_9ACTN|nr:3-oxoacyl-ACP reductase [Nocardiopsis coralli]MBE3002378.1 3-oxoacyl-ACP reductase [Nocardiopsis coralli]